MRATRAALLGAARVCVVVACACDCGGRTTLLVQALDDAGALVPPRVTPGNPCTTDADCADGNYCVAAVRCDPVGGCLLTARDCDDGIACTRDACDPTAGRCTHSPDDTRCPDTQLCSAKRGCDAFVYSVSSDGHLYEARVPSGAVVDLGAPAASLGDIALGDDGVLYATDSYVLYRVDRATAETATIASIVPLHLYNGLGSAHDGTLQATADVPQLFQVARTDGSAKPLARLPAGYRASGDVTMLGSRILVTAASPLRSSDALVEIDAAAQTAGVVGDIGLRCVWGLATLGGVLYGLTCEGRLLAISAANGRATELARAVPAFVGAAAR